MSPTTLPAALYEIDLAIESYIAACRRRIPQFVARHFSVRESVALQRRSLLSDMALLPVNTLWAVPALMVRKAAEVCDKLGFAGTAARLRSLPISFRTRYQVEIETLIAGELAHWPARDAARSGVPREFTALLAQKPAVAELLKGGGVPARALNRFPEIEDTLRLFSSGREMVTSLFNTMLTVAAGWLFFSDSSLGILGMGKHLAGRLAHEEAASGFFLGRSLGSAFYTLFPPEPTLAQVFWSTVAVGALVTVCSLVGSVCADPLRKRFGLMERRLNVLLDELEAQLTVHARRRLRKALGG